MSRKEDLSDEGGKTVGEDLRGFGKEISRCGGS
jgi:hypothetical protein